MGAPGIASCAVRLRAASVAAMLSSGALAQNPFEESASQHEPAGIGLSAQLGYGFGDLDYVPQDGGLERDREHYGWLRGRIEFTPPPGIGLGISGELGSFDGAVVVGPAPFREDVEGRLVEGFLYAVFTGRADRLQCPLRLGVADLDHSVETEDGRKFEYDGVALRVQAEPEFAFFDDGSTRLSVYALGSYSWGGGRFESTPSAIRDDLDLMQVGFEFGARLRLGPVWIGMGWARNDTRWRGDDVFSDLDLTFDGLVFSIGASN